ncbi:MAG: glycosyltransferase family 4 protein [Gudongella sp.]|nr:glycosyltransferase family 4 protein [Gudongella sp.]
MKILNIISQYPGKTGSGTYLRALMDQANKNGYRQALIAAIQPELSYINTSVDYMDMVEFNTPELPFPIIGMSDKMPYESSVFSIISDEHLEMWEEAFKAKLEKAIEEFKPDIILCHHLWLASSIVCEHKKDTKVYVVCHGTDIRQFQKIHFFRERLINGFEKLDGVFALTQEQKCEINELYKIDEEKIYTVGSGYDERFFYPLKNKTKSKQIKLVYAGKLSYAKGLIPLIEVYTKLLEEYDLELTIAGSGSGEERDEILALGESVGINFTGAVPQKILGNIFRESDIFILPSYYEGLSLVALEAIASELLCVVTDVGGIKGFLGEKIIDSGVIQFVALPEMKNVDEPLDRDYNLYINNLENAIKKQINNYNMGYNKFAPLNEEIVKFSWANIFKKIEACF